MAGFEARGAQDRRRLLRRAKQLRRGFLAAFALLLCGAAIAQADTGSIGAVGLNDIRSDGILLPNADWDGSADLTLAANAGVTLYRARVQLNCVDPNNTGTFNFTSPSSSCYGLSYDQLVAALADRGMTLLPVLIDLDKSGVPVPPTANGNPSISEFAAFAAAAAKRYGPNGTFWPTCGCTPEPIQAWEIWNEENNGWWWGGDASASAYGAVLQATRSALRSVDPQARIVVGGLTFDPNGESSFVEPADFIKGLAASNANAFDAVAVHPYTDAQGASAAQLASAAMAYVNETASALVAATGPSATGGPRQQIWVTEMGWSTTDASAATIADGLQDFLGDVQSDRTQDNIGPVLWYMLRDNATIGSRDDGLGLRYTSSDGSDAGAKPAWAVLSSAAQQMGTVALPPALSDTGPYVPGATTATVPTTKGASGAKSGKPKKASKHGHKAAVRCSSARRHGRIVRTCKRVASARTKTKRHS
ncbi:MAG: cellulase family glycosylhydrolase [Solirubrobacteraceae bacterium]